MASSIRSIHIIICSIKHVAIGCFSLILIATAARARSPCSEADNQCYKQCEATYGQNAPGKWWNCQGQCDKAFRECGKAEDAKKSLMQCASSDVRPDRFKSLSEDVFRSRRRALQDGVTTFNELQGKLEADFKEAKAQELRAHLLKIVATTANLIENIGKLFPANATYTVSKQVYDGIKAGKDIYDFIKKDAESLAADTLLKEAAKRNSGTNIESLVRGLQATKKLAQDIDELAKMATDGTAMRAEFLIAIDRNKREIAKLEAEIRDGEQHIRDDSIAGLIEKYQEVKAMCADTQSAP